MTVDVIQLMVIGAEDEAFYVDCFYNVDDNDDYDRSINDDDDSNNNYDSSFVSADCVNINYNYLTFVCTVIE